MFRRILSVSFIASVALLLSGCLAVTPTPAPKPTPTPLVGLLPEQAQQLVLTTCGIVVDTGVAQQIASLFVPGVDVIAPYIKAVCGLFLKNETRLAIKGMSSRYVVARFRGANLVGRRAYAVVN
jgi:hypothetical protein